MSLSWDAPVDLDLYLTDPSTESLYFANNPTRSGARLEADVRCADLATSAPIVELARVGEPLDGVYRVGVDFLDSCGNDTEVVPFRVAVDYGGDRLEKTGQATAGQFQVIVLEFEIDPLVSRVGSP